MMIPRFMLILVALALGFSCLGCSQSHNPASAPPADEGNDQPVAEASSQIRKTISWWQDDSIVTKLELSDDQARAVDQLMTEESKNSSQAVERERQLSLRYLRVLSQEPYDVHMVDRLTNQLTEVLTNKHRRRVERLRGLRDILNQDQWTTLWEVAPRALQIGRFRVARGPKISVTDEDPPPALKP